MGGSAIEFSSRINDANLKETLNLALEVLLSVGLDTKEIEPLGSFGKKGPESTYGDIDLSVPLSTLENLLDPKDFDTKEKFEQAAANTLKELLENEGLTVRYFKGFSLLSFGVPIVNIDGKQPDNWAQIDLMFTDSPEFSQWMFYSPDISKSKWKGLYRNVLLMAIANQISKEIIESHEDYPVEWFNDSLDLVSGLKQKKMSLKGKSGLLKNPKVVSKEFYEWGKDVQTIVEYLLGVGTKIEDTYTFEDVWRIISNPSWEHHDLLNDIKKEFIRKLPENVEIPKEVLN